MKDFTEEYVWGCAVCQQNKPHTTHRKAPLQPITTDPHSGPFQMVAMDLITDLPKSQGFNAILTIIDHGCSKAAKFIPCNTTITGQGVAALYLQHLVLWFGIPQKVISDRDPRFVLNFTKELCRLLHIQQNISTTFHPRTDGSSEWANQWLEQYLWIWMADDQMTWVQFLSLTEFIHNSWPYDRTTLTPHELLFGTKPPFCHGTLIFTYILLYFAYYIIRSWHLVCTWWLGSIVTWWCVTWVTAWYLLIKHMMSHVANEGQTGLTPGHVISYYI